MNIQTQQSADGQSTVVTHPSHPDVNLASRRRFATKILMLTSKLQTTLETNELLAIFAREILGTVRYDGMSYQFPSLKIDIKLGDQEKHRAHYELVMADDHLGDLRFFRAEPFEESELETIENLLAGLIYPLRNTLLYQQALRSSVTDPLTGVYNRSTMDTIMRREIDLAHRHNSPFSALMVDLDHFKEINDNYGHQCGDKALQHVARCITRNVRESDMVFRYGGEEFLILLSGTELGGAQLLAERIRRNIEQLQACEDQELHLTASIGIATVNGGDDTHSLFQRLDQALYQAKNNGRNQLVIGY